MGVADIRHMEALGTEEATELNMYQEPAAPQNERRFKLYRRGPLSLTQVLPMFTDLGVEVVDERPYEIDRSDGVTVHIYDFGLRVRNDKVWTGESRDRMRELFQEAVWAVWNGRAESDGFNALVLGAGLTWRQVVIIRTVAKYLRQTAVDLQPGLPRERPRPEPRHCGKAGVAVRDPLRPEPVCRQGQCRAHGRRGVPRRGDHASTR